MRTTYLHQQHQRCLSLLEMIAKCDLYVKNCSDNLKRYHSLKWMDQMPGVEEYNEKNISKYTAIRERLTQSYENCIDSITSKIGV